jgi:rubrerythrin
MSKYHHAAANGNILDAAMTALKPLVSPEVLKESEVAARVTTLAGTEVITQAEARSASALTSLQEMADQLRSLKSRLELAMDSIAIAAGAWHCQECGEWTTRSIPHEDTLYCPEVPAARR